MAPGYTDYLNLFLYSLYFSKLTFHSLVTIFVPRYLPNAIVLGGRGKFTPSNFPDFGSKAFFLVLKYTFSQEMF